ncbi:TFIIB-type zinc finger domain-containing protein [Dysosmobacter sp. Marseille-Q4140]|nr:TFIIB-type zinc finger domain-containing protein [Dysosmobacter sp. Marseille-Q4140]
MKQLTCEMCGSTDLVKQDGVFVCQSCGTKYSIEEAKKMMVEGTVDVSGSTVKVDSSDELNNLYQIARRARDENNAENAAKYYDMILVKDPTSWEATFYVVYFQASNCRIAQIQSAAISVANCIKSALRLIKENVENVDEQVEYIQEISLHSMNLATQLYIAATKTV